MTTETLATKLLALKGFQERLTSILVENVAHQFSALSNGVPTLPSREWDYLLTCASVLAQSDEGACQDAALRIAHASVARGEADNAQRAAAAVVLDMLSNAGALALAEERQLISAEAMDRLPTPLLLDRLARRIRTSVFDPETGAPTQLNRFQWGAYEAIAESSWVSISAPTSAGKSFLLGRVVRDFFAADGLAAVYVVPTRALVQEVELRLGEALRRAGPHPVRVSSVPAKVTENESRVLFVFTQERLHWLFASSPDFAPQLLVVDEAQKIGDGARGILLQSVVQEAQKRCATLRVVFSSPMAANPAVLLTQAPSDTPTRAFTSDAVTVNQNLIWVSQFPRQPTHWTAKLIQGDRELPLGDFRLSNRPTRGKRLPFVAHALTHHAGGTLVYVNVPSDAEKTARLIWDLEGSEAETNDPKISELVELVKKTVHPKYSLATVLRRRVAFHYGNMPLIIRAEIENLFRAGNIRFLVCTSTLLEGVNLPAKSIVLRAPRKGRTRSLTDVDFWNLAGRAGRLGMEFQGNVICVDPEEWEPPRQRAKFRIEAATSALARTDASQFLDYLRDGAPLATSTKRPEFEHAFVLLARNVLDYGSVGASPLARTLPGEFVASTETLVAQMLSGLELPPDIVRRNPGISPLGQQSLLNYFRQRSPELAEELIPPPPESDDAVDGFVHVIGRIAKHLSGEPQARHYYHAVLVVQWMRGMPLAAIIAKAWQYWSTRGKALAAVIRETMAEIEEYARFRFAKYSYAYTDVLRFHLSQVRPDLVGRVADLNLLLEFGASQQTQVALMDLGLSRTSAIEVSDLIGSDSLGRSECREWILGTDLDTLPLSPIILAELARVRGSLYPIAS